jgi:hypothetical protein
VGFQGVASLKNLNDVSPNFLWLPPLFGRNPDAAAPHSGTRAHLGPSGFSGSRRFTLQLGRGHIHGGGAIRIERILNLADIPVLETYIHHFP